jgi:hypothetical protein
MGSQCFDLRIFHSRVGGFPGNTMRHIRGALTMYREDVRQPATRQPIVITKILNKVTATVDGDTLPGQVFANHFHQYITVREFGMVAPYRPPVLEKWNLLQSDRHDVSPSLLRLLLAVGMITDPTGK